MQEICIVQSYKLFREAWSCFLLPPYGRVTWLKEGVDFLIKPANIFVMYELEYKW